MSQPGVVLPGELALLTAADLAGQPFDTYRRGPPLPPCDAGRVAQMARYGPIEGAVLSAWHCPMRRMMGLQLGGGVSASAQAAHMLRLSVASRVCTAVQGDNKPHARPAARSFCVHACWLPRMCPTPLQLPSPRIMRSYEHS